jgi:hypothetical protein
MRHKFQIFAAFLPLIFYALHFYSNILGALFTNSATEKGYMDMDMMVKAQIQSSSFILFCPICWQTVPAIPWVFFRLLRLPTNPRPLCQSL